MNPLEELHNKIDKSGWDIGNDDLINKAFQETNGLIADNSDLRRKSETEHLVFAFNKTAKKGLSSKMSGTKTLENGETVPFEWPDVNELTESDFAYIRERFNATQNLFSKTEYGLVLYYGGQMKKNREEALVLVKSLFELAKVYHDKIFQKEKEAHYVQYFQLALSNNLKIASERNSDKEVNDILTEMINFIADVHNGWDEKHESTLRIALDLTRFAVEYKKYFEKIVALDKFLDKNYAVAHHISKSYNWGAIYICDISQKLSDAIGNTKYDWQTLKAEQYILMVQPAIDMGNMAAVNYVESALTIYKQIKNAAKIDELSKKYEEVRKIFRFGEIKKEFPEEESTRITKVIKKEIETKSGRELVEVLTMTPMFPALDQIKENAKVLYESSVFSQFFPTSIVDKHGNTVEVFTDEAEKKKYQFWQAYELSFQVGSQTLTQLFIGGVKANKINYYEVINFIEVSWMGQKYPELYNGHQFEVCPLDAVKPGLKLLFDELELWKKDNTYQASFVCATDSLITKTEYLLRYFCKLAGIPTFTDKQKGTHKLKMEKNLDEILRSLEDKEDRPTGFSEEHRIYIQFILAQKAGLNLRNRIAHGLMDANEYGLTNTILALTIILKLSAYSFKPEQ